MTMVHIHTYTHHSHREHLSYGGTKYITLIALFTQPAPHEHGSRTFVIFLLEKNSLKKNIL